MYVLGYSGFTRDSRSADGYRNPFAKTKQDFDSVFMFHEGEVPFQMFPLGFFGHDASAALLCDGELVACAAEERFTRAKFALNLAGNTLLPKHAIAYCLKEAGIGIDDVDIVAHYCRFDSQAIADRQALIAPFVSPDESAMIGDSYRKVFMEMMDLPVLLRQFEAMTGGSPRRFEQVPHHLAHAASAFYPSGFHEALIYTIDGTGERESALLAVGRGTTITEESRTMLPTSLGTLYLLVTVLLGFRSLGDEYKVMGLAGYGNPARYRDFFRSLVRLHEDGSHTLEGFARSDLKSRLTEALGMPRMRGEEIAQHHCDIAAALQEALEEAVLHALTHAQRRLGLRKLCMAGGVALNSMMNGVIARSGLFDDIFVQPAAGDEGGALGAAQQAWHQYGEGNGASPQLRHVYTGPGFDNTDITAALEKHADAVAWDISEHITEDVAEALANGKVAGWFQGRMEFGPRALGNRSILADPRPADMKDRINAKVKHREGFRPFAPAVTVEDVHDFFDMSGLHDSPYMLFVVPVLPDKRSEIPAVTHVDGTARVQTVSRDSNPRFHELIRAFGRRTGLPVLLNTSFNVMHEPIVCTPDDAIRCFLNTDIDLLALGDFIVTRRTEDAGQI
ncbi:MAG: hypothetical protein M5R41_07255 [Bacteroidia bacterium]|nr:hypothetical protein [Bacteroidia bacterium]